LRRFKLANITEDKRVYERFDLKVPARLGILGTGQWKADDEVSLTTDNICAGGAFFVTEAQLPRGTRIKMDFVLSIDKLKELLDSQCRIKVQGEVIRTDESGIAVRFDEDYEIMPVKGSMH
jgi:hypothetical protein